MAVVVVLIFLFMGRYNGFVTADERVTTAWSQVENQYQRRADLVPNLVNTVQGFADQEQEVLIGVTEARAKASQTTVDLDNPESLQAFQAAQGELSSALSRLLVTVESYPVLKSDQNFLALQTQLEGTENRIATERMRFNEEVRNYNILVRSFPGNIVAGLFGFDQKAQFEAVEGSDVAPVVQFE